MYQTPFFRISRKRKSIPDLRRITLTQYERGNAGVPVAIGGRRAPRDAPAAGDATREPNINALTSQFITDSSSSSSESGGGADAGYAAAAGSGRAVRRVPAAPEGAAVAVG